MYALFALFSLLFWTAAAALSTLPAVLRGEAPSAVQRIGRLFFAGSTLLSVILWLFIYVSYRTDAQFSRTGVILPPWYHGVIAYIMPQALLAIAASAARNPCLAGLFLRFKAGSLLAFDWYYLVAALPGSIAARAEAQSLAGPSASPTISVSDLRPLFLVNLAGMLFFLLLAAVIWNLERNYRRYEPPLGLQDATG
jgi:hypothetical protein